MNNTHTTKKIMMAAILTSGLTLAISQAVMAQPEKHGAVDGKGKDANTPCHYQPDGEMQKARDKFLTETFADRKALAQKSAEMRAIMQAGTPDTAKASQVAGELFEIREKLRAKATEAGMPLPMLMMGHGCDGMGYLHDGDNTMMKHHNK